MNLTLPEKQRLSNQTLTIYVISAMACIVAVAIVVGIQVLGNDIINNLVGVSKITKKTEQEELALKANFENLFNNTLEVKNTINASKIDNNQDIIYTSYTSNDKSTDNYDLNVNIPFINIKNSKLQEYNEKISDIFEKKAKELLKSKDENVVYTVKYQAYIENNILSLIIYSDLKQISSPQRVIIQTFNYNLETNKEMTLNDIINVYGLNSNFVQTKINNEINTAEKNAKELKSLGYNVFTRNTNNDIYNVNNVSEFFVHDNNLYIIFAYGNTELTTEKDIVVI